MFYKIIKAGPNRVYYITTKEDKNGNIYLVFKEVKNREDGSKEVHRIMVFEKDLKNFVETFKSVLRFINDRDFSTSKEILDSSSNISKDVMQTKSENDNQKIELNNTLGSNTNNNDDSFSSEKLKDEYLSDLN